MIPQSKWIVENEPKSQLIRASTIKPRIDYAKEIVDVILDILAQKRQDLNRHNLYLYQNSDGKEERLGKLQLSLKEELVISYVIESLRQVRRGLDSVVGLGNIPTVLSPNIAIVRTVRSSMLSVMPVLDAQLGELSLLLGGVIIDSAHLASSCLDFGMANQTSKRLLDEAKLIADSKICKQFPNLDFS